MNLGYHKIIMDIQNYFWMSKNGFLDSHNSFLDIQKSIYGYPKIHFWISKNRIMIIQYSTDFWISKNLFMEIQNSGCILGYS